MSKTHTATLIPGDGIGPEITQAVLHVLEASGVKIEWERVEVGEESLRQGGEVLPEAVFDSIRRHKVALKGPVGTPIGGGHRSVNVTIRQTLDLYACLRPVKTLAGVESRYDDVDLVIVRENTEGLYSGLEHMVTPGVAQSLKIVTEKASLRAARFAFDYAQRYQREKVTAVHKANIMKISDGLFLECCRRVREDYPQIGYEEMIVDNCAMQLVRRPEQFEVLVMDNLYGDIMSDLAAGLVGGLGVAPGANFGDDMAVFEPIHGTAPDIAGQGLANPTALLLSGTLLLRRLGYDDKADLVRGALEAVVAEGGQRVTRDLGGAASTMDFAETVAQRVRAG